MKVGDKVNWIRCMTVTGIVKIVLCKIDYIGISLAICVKIFNPRFIYFGPCILSYQLIYCFLKLDDFFVGIITGCILR